MSESKRQFEHKVIIASANPLFGRGLQKIYSKRWEADSVEIRLSDSMETTLRALDDWSPDLVIVDYDDRSMRREEFLSHFFSGSRPMQVVLVSLQESGEVVIYDRRTLTPAQAGDWLNFPWQETSPSPQSAVRSSRRSGNMKHFAIVGVLVVISTFLINLLLNSIGILPVEASAQATVIDRLFSAHFLLISFLFSLITVFLIYSLVVFRARPGDTGPGKYIKGNSRLEVVWTVIPLGAVVVFSFFGAQNLAETRRADPQALNVKVTAFQWGWIFDYPDYGVTSNTLYLPVNKQVNLSLTSRDVIHSFWVPEFRVKQDALPGANLVKQLRITPTKEGKYTLMCAELCGGAHAYMNAVVQVVSPANFQTWITEQANTAITDPVQRGQKWSQNSGCIACHSADGTKLSGPTWKGLSGSTVTLTDGTTLTADDAYLKSSILKPNDQVVQGYAANVMPATYANLLTDSQVMDIIAYINSLK